MYVITRNDLPAGVQAVQSAHALLDFSVKYPQLTKNWNQISNYLCILSVDNQELLQELALITELLGIKHVVFHEPDRNNELTAIAIEPGRRTKALCSGLSLALKCPR